MYRIAIATAVLLLAAGCGEDQDPRLQKIEDKAPSWAETHTDQQTLDFLDEVCKTQQLSHDPPEGVTLHDYGYVQGLALGSCR